MIVAIACVCVCAIIGVQIIVTECVRSGVAKSGPVGALLHVD